MKEKHYQPSPVDTSSVTLPEELMALGELIAKNVHEVWAEGRIREGWTYGGEKDSVLKTTPCLVPYEDLPEEEKEFDRKTAMETLRLIRKLGFKIVPEKE